MQRKAVKENKKIHIPRTWSCRDEKQGVLEKWSCLIEIYFSIISINNHVEKSFLWINQRNGLQLYCYQSKCFYSDRVGRCAIMFDFLTCLWTTSVLGLSCCECRQKTFVSVLSTTVAVFCSGLQLRHTATCITNIISPAGQIKLGSLRDYVTHSPTHG